MQGTPGRGAQSSAESSTDTSAHSTSRTGGVNICIIRANKKHVFSRHYNYRQVPYFGGSDDYRYKNLILRVVLREIQFHALIRKLIFLVL